MAFAVKRIQQVNTDYGFNGNPSLRLRKNVETQLHSVPVHENLMSNLACHNLCENTYIRASDLKLIGLDLNFCVTDSPPSLPDFGRFGRSVRIRHQFAGKESKNFEPKLHVAASDWMPDDADPAIEAAF
jgi:hypothetical protein